MKYVIFFRSGVKDTRRPFAGCSQSIGTKFHSSTHSAALVQGGHHLATIHHVHTPKEANKNTTMQTTNE